MQLLEPFTLNYFALIQLSLGVLIVDHSYIDFAQEYKLKLASVPLFIRSIASKLWLFEVEFLDTAEFPQPKSPES